MGVSLRRLRLMVRAIIPGFKLMFKTIKTGIASTGIGVIVLALTAVGTAMARTSKGAKAFKMVLAGVKEVVNFFDLNKKSEILFDKPIIYNTNNNFKSNVIYKIRNNK